MRDVRKVKEKYEVALESQQIFFIFAGLVAYTALVFVLGIVVGKTRAPRADDIAAAASQLPQERDPVTVTEQLAAQQPVEDTAGSLRIYQLDQENTPNSIANAIPASATSAVPVASATPPSAAATAAVAASSPAAVAPFSDGKLFAVQAAAYTELGQASQMVSDLKAKGFHAYTVSYKKAGGPTYHRVRVGDYKTRAEAEGVSKKISTSMPVQPAVVVVE